MALNDVFGVGFRLDERQLNYKILVLGGIFGKMLESGILSQATEEQKQLLEEMAMVFSTYFEQVNNEIKDTAE